MQTDFLCLIHQGERIEVAIRAAAGGMGMKIDEHAHFFCSYLSVQFSRRHLYTVFSVEGQESRCRLSGIAATISPR
jgi:hypothetical protein